MFKLSLYDREGTELQIGDTVKISDGKDFHFFAEVKYLPEEKIITPFHTFSFHSFVKVNEVPANAIKSDEERYNIWYLYQDDAEPDESAKEFSEYLMGWRQCEHLLEHRYFRINPITTGQQKLFA